MSLGKKFNKGKIRLSLNPEEALEAMARAFMMGAEKYGDFNYRKGIPMLDLIDSLERHILKYKKNIDLDEESGLPHTFHILANAAMIEFMRVNYPELDNRYKGRKNASQSKTSKSKRNVTKVRKARRRRS